MVRMLVPIVCSERTGPLPVLPNISVTRCSVQLAGGHLNNVVVGRVVDDRTGSHYNGLAGLVGIEGHFVH